MYFTSIDGQPVAFMHDGKMLEFRPGKHVLEANISNYKASGETNFMFPALAVYELYGKGPR